MIPFTPDERRAQFAPSQNVGGPVDPDILDIIGERPQPTMAQQVEYEVPEVKPVDPDVLDIVNESQGPMMASLMGASRVNPDQAAEAKRLGSQIGVGQDIALRNLEDVRKRAFMADIQRRDIARANPVLAGFLSDPTFANEASDDIEPLSRFERTMDYIADLPSEFGAGFRTGQVLVEAGMLGSTAQLRGRATEDEIQKWNQYQAELQTLSGDVGFWRQTGETLGQLARAGEEAVKGGVAGGVMGAGAALLAGQLGPQVFLPEEIVTVPAATLFGVGAGITSAFVTTSARTMAGNNYMKNIESGMDPDVARVTALGVGVIGGALELFGMKLVAAPFKGLWSKVVSDAANDALVQPTVAKAVANAGLQYSKAVGGEIGTEVGQQITEIAFDEIAGYASDPNFESRFATPEGRLAIREELKDIIVRTALGMSVLGGIGPGANLYVDTRRAGKAVRSQQAIQSVVEAVNAANLKRRDPDALEAFGNAALRETPAFIRGDTLREILDANEVSNAEIDAIVPGLSTKIQEAVDADNFVSLPLAQFGVRLAGTKVGDAMVPHLTVDPTAMTPAELEAFNANVQEFTALAAAEYEAKTQSESAFVQEADQVATTMRERLIAAGRDPALAEVESLVHQAFVVTQAARQGKTPAQFEAESGLREIVGAEMPVAPLEQANRDLIASVDAELGGIMDAAKEASRAAGKTRSKDTQAAAFKAKQEWIAANPARYEEYQAAQRTDALENERVREAAASALAGKIDESLATAAKTLTDAGFVLDYESPAPSKSRYYRKGNTLIRLSDHEIPVTQERAAAREAGVQVPYRDFVFDGTAVDAELIQDLEAFAARTTANIMEQAAVPAAFYSALGRAIDGIDIKSASAAGWKERIKGLVNKGDIKQDELTWSGLEDWLSLPREGKITKDEVAAFLKNNGVRVERVTLGQDVSRINASSPYAIPEVMRYAQEFQGNAPEAMLLSIENDGDVYRALARRFPKLVEREDWAQVVVDDVFGGGENVQQAKYAKYTLPGGTNYREVLLTLTPSELTGTIEELPNGRFRVDYPGMRSVVVDTREDAESELEESRLAMGDKAGVLFRSEHWTQPNVVAHLRMNDRVDADGKRVLFVEEIQSDWAQAGRKKGFEGPEAIKDQEAAKAQLVDVQQRFDDAYARLEKARIGVTRALRDILESMGLNRYEDIISAGERKPELKQEYEERKRVSAEYEAAVEVADRAQNEVDALSQELSETRSRAYPEKRIPIAPFVARQQFAVFKGDKEVTRKNKEGKEVKQRYSSMKAAEAAAAKVGGEARDIGMQADTEGWVNLALKQIMLEAVNGGYDKVAFINGEQSKDRYDLGKEVDRIVVAPRDDGKSVNIELKAGDILSYGVDADGVITATTEDSGRIAKVGTPLADVIGKEMAEKVMQTERGTFAGEDLKVGGEGMVAFYDKIVPAATSKLLEKLDGGRLGQVGITEQGTMRNLSVHSDGTQYWLEFNDGNRASGNVASYLEADAIREQLERGISKQPGFDVTDAMRDKVTSGLPLFQAMPGRGPARGGYDPSRLKILFGKGADFTTGAHELTHYYVDYYTKQALAGTAAPQMLADLDIMFKFMGVAGATPEERLAAFNAMPFETARPLIETITYNAEIYLFEGKAPSLELAGVFDRMLAFFRRAYKSIADFVTQQREIYRREFGRELPELSDELRQVFDRMLADERQIKQAQAVAQMRGQFTVKPEGMDDAEWAAYQEMAGEATNAAIADMTKASLRQMEWLSRARSRIIKDMQARHTAQRKEVRERVQREVQQNPLYRAMAFLRRGQVVAPDGTVTEAEGVHRIDRVLAAEFAPTVDLARLGGRFGVLQDDGLHPDIVAEMFGYPAGATLLQDLADAKPMREVVEDRTDAEMLRLYGEMNTPAAREQEIQKALHNEARARLVGVELRFMGKIQQPVRVLLEAARQAAQQAIGRRRIVEIRPSEFVAAEAKASREVTAAMQENKPDAAVRAKRAQLLNNQLAKAALEARDEIDNSLKGFSKFFKADAKIAESRDLAMVMAARAILASRGIGQSDKAPAAYVDQLQANNPGLYAELAPIIMQAGAGDYRQMTVAEFRVLAESVEALWSRARRDRQIQVGERKVELDLVVSEMIAAMEKIKRPAVQPGVREAVGFKDVAKRQAMEVRAANRRVESWSDALDAADPKRPFTTYLWQPVKDAVVRFRQIRNDKVKKFYELVTKLDIPKNSIDAPELEYTFGRGNAGTGKAELLGAMLHTGNESNYRKLLLGRQWATLDGFGNMDDSRWKRFVDRMIAQGILTKADFDFLQSVWDLNEEIKPLLQKAHYDLEGYYFKEVQASPVVTPFGIYRGGYVPAATDRFMVSDAVQRAGMQELEQDWRFSLPSTGMGMTKARVQGYTKPLALDVRLIVSHVDAALRFAIIQPAVVDALKILKNRSFAAEINKIDPTAITAMLLPWLNRSAHQTVSQPGRFKSVDAFWRGVRTRTGMSIMFANLRNAFQQITGLFPSAIKVSPVYLKNASATYLGDPRGTANMIAATDPFMDQRMRDQVYEMQEQMNDLLLNPSKFDKVQAWNKQHAYFLQTAFQNQVDIITWLGAYNQSLAESGVGVSEEKARKQAIRDAGAAVRLTQGSILPEDISAFEAGTPFYRTFTQFAGYFNGIANLNATEMVKTVRTMGFRGGKGKLLYIYLLGFALPALVSDAIVRSMGGGWEDDDEDGYLDVFMDWFFGSQIRMGAALVPFGSTAYQLVTTPFDNKPYNDRMNNSPSIQAIESSTIGTGKAIVNLLDDDKELTGKNVRDVLTAITLATGIPVSVLGRPAGYLVDVYRGEIEPEGPIDFTMGLLTGTAAPSTRR